MEDLASDSNNVVVSSSAVSPKAIKFTGSNNSITVEDGAVLNGFSITIKGSNNKIVIGKRCTLRGRIFLVGKSSSVHIGDDTTFVDVRITAGGRRRIVIGKDCMFSRKIEVRCWDEHPIYDISTKQHINPGKDVFIGDHVWVGVGASINKGSNIPSGCVIGSGSVVNKPLEERNSIYVGTPARLHRTGIVWGRSHKDVPWDSVADFDDEELEQPDPVAITELN